MTTRVDGSGLGARRQKVVAGAQQHLDVLEESLAGGPLPLLPELGRELRERAGEALEAVVLACRLADWLEGRLGSGAQGRERDFSPYFESFFGRMGQPAEPVPAPENEAEQLGAVRERIGLIDQTAASVAGVLGEGCAPLLVAVARRDCRQAREIVEALTEVLGQVGAQARALCGQDLEDLESSSGS